MFVILLLVTQVALYCKGETAFKDYPCKVDINKPRLTGPPYNLTVTWSSDNGPACDERFTIYVWTKQNIDKVIELTTEVYCNQLTLTVIPKLEYKVGVIQHLKQNQTIMLNQKSSIIEWSNSTDLRKEYSTEEIDIKQIRLEVNETCTTRKQPVRTEQKCGLQLTPFVIVTIVLSLCVLRLLIALVKVKCFSPGRNTARRPDSTPCHTEPCVNTANALYSAGSYPAYATPYPEMCLRN